MQVELGWFLHVVYLPAQLVLQLLCALLERRLKFAAARFFLPFFLPPVLKSGRPALTGRPGLRLAVHAFLTPMQLLESVLHTGLSTSNAPKTQTYLKERFLLFLDWWWLAQQNVGGADDHLRIAASLEHRGWLEVGGGRRRVDRFILVVAEKKSK